MPCLDRHDPPISRAGSSMPVVNSFDEPLTQRQLIAAALDLFVDRGYAETSMRDIADAADVPLDRTYLLFGHKEAFALALYHRLSVDLEAQASELPDGGVAQRFSAAMRMKFDLLAPHRQVLVKLLPVAIDPENRLSALSEHTQRIRARVQGVFQSVVQGASDCADEANGRSLSRSLYGVHLGLVLLWLQAPTAAEEALQLVEDLLTMLGPMLTSMDWENQILSRVDRVFGQLVQPARDDAHFTQAENILRVLFRHRRLLDPDRSCAAHPCPQCFALHLPMVENLIRRELPIRLLLPGFPAKSANRTKTLGPLPDLGEELSLRFLITLCDEIRSLYPPGARITICSDGRVFNDLVGVSDDHVSAYRRQIVAIIQQTGADHLDMFDLDDVFRGNEHTLAREELVRQYADDLELVVERTHQFDHHRAMFNGIHRFVFEDQIALQSTQSRTQVRKQAKQTAYEVIRRSNAWSRLIAECFPDALRLSIHPQDPHSDKIGILLTHAEDQWITPWHGCVLLDAEQYTLVRRSHAESCGASLVLRDAQPSHYERTQDSPT
ncbi:MAG: hypothetical protein CMJ59_18530 [Planctomycetaceae bacterium]|nr:hypothetical protein [Planctomycetaceae bacterium]